MITLIGLYSISRLFHITLLHLFYNTIFFQDISPMSCTLLYSCSRLAYITRIPYGVTLKWVSRGTTVAWHWAPWSADQSAWGKQCHSKSKVVSVCLFVCHRTLHSQTARGSWEKVQQISRLILSLSRESKIYFSTAQPDIVCFLWLQMVGNQFYSWSIFWNSLNEKHIWFV